MSSVNIVARTTSSATSSGIVTYYVLEVYKQGTNQLISSKKTVNEDEAKAFLAEQKSKFGLVKINGKDGTDPFSDGTFKSASKKNFETGNIPTPTPPPFRDRVPSSQTQFNNEPRNQLSEFDQSSRDGTLSNLVPNISIPKARVEKKARDLTGMSEEKRKKFESLTEKQKAQQKISGVFGAKRIQAVIDRENVPSELVVGRGPDNNAFIVIGNDRVDKPHTGYGGKGHTQSDAIDIVAGMASFNPQEVQKKPLANGQVAEVKVKTNPSFFLDAARIYVSQKTDVDKNFRIGEFGKASNNSKDNKDDENIGKYGAKSAIAMKADNIRIISREAVKIVTGTDDKNSQGGQVQGHGIDLIAGNDITTLQPMVLGDNLSDLLKKIIKNIENLAKYLHQANNYQMKFNQAMSKHTHVGFFNAKPTLQSEEAKAAGFQFDVAKISKTDLSAMKEMTNLSGLINNYLVLHGTNKKGNNSYILSKLNNCN